MFPKHVLIAMVGGVLILLLFLSFHIERGPEFTRIDIGPIHMQHKNAVAVGQQSGGVAQRTAIFHSQISVFDEIVDFALRNISTTTTQGIVTLLTIIASILAASESTILAVGPNKREMQILVTRSDDGETGGDDGEYRPNRNWWPPGNWSFVIFGLLAALLGITMLAGVFMDVKASGATALLAPPAPVCASARKDTNVAIVMIHGWTGDDTTWQKFPELLCSDQRLKDTQVFLVNYPSYMVRRNLGISQMSRWLRQTFFSDTLRDYQTIHIVAHSMGGLIARTIYLDDAQASKKIKSIVSIASPFEGANMASLLSLFGLSKEYTEEMSPESIYIRTLADRWTDLEEKPITYCYTSPTDGIVQTMSAKRQCDCTHDYPQWNHIDMVKPESDQDERYYMPVRGLKNAMAAAGLPPGNRHPRCFSLAHAWPGFSLARY